MQAAEHWGAHDLHAFRQPMPVRLRLDRQSLGWIGNPRPETRVRALLDLHDGIGRPITPPVPEVLPCPVGDDDE
jgi:hypothetical protein